MRAPQRPSGLFRLILKLLVPRRHRDVFLDDMDELFRLEGERIAADPPRSPMQRRRSLAREIAGALLLRLGRLPQGDQ